MSCKTRLAPLTAEQARASLANRLSPTVDRLRQRLTTFGLRSDRVFMVWTRFGGERRGEGAENELARVELLPTPRVSDMTAVNFQPYSAGILPNGVLRIDRISNLYTEEQLTGQAIPIGAGMGGLEGRVNGSGAGCPPAVSPLPGDTTPSGDTGALTNPPTNPPLTNTECLLDQSIIGPGGKLCTEEPVDFFYEIVEDGRGANPPSRQKYRIFSHPWRNEDGFEWVILIERISEDRNDAGQSMIGPDYNIDALTLDADH